MGSPALGAQGSHCREMDEDIPHNEQLLACKAISVQVSQSLGARRQPADSYSAGEAELKSAWASVKGEGEDSHL